MLKEGFDGSEVHIRERPIPGTRQTQVSAMRCRPGTFERQYGCAKSGTTDDALFLAGSDFSRLWERAGLDGPRSVDWSKEGFSLWSGLPDARAEAISKIRPLVQFLGQWASARMVSYLVQGKTSDELAAVYGFSQREMRAILRSDLVAVATHFGYISNSIDTRRPAA